MKPIGIAGTGSYVAPKVMTNNDWLNYVETSDEWIYSKTGIKERRIAEPGVATSDLAVEAANKALKDAGVKARDVGLIVLATSSPDVPLSATACIVQHKLGAEKAAALDINNVCSGFVYGLDIGWKMAATDSYENVLVIGAETYSRILNWKDRTTCVFFGDGAGAVVLKECKPGLGLLASTLYADGSGHKVIEIPAGGSRMPTTHETFDKGLNYFFMDGKAVWDFATVKFPESVREVVAKAGRKMDDVDIIIPHQSNVNIIKKSMEVLGLPMEKAYVHIQKYGNMAGASVPVALDEAVREGRVKKGALVVTCGYGGGLAWGANAMIWNR
jgi:3-oxoacyl-[acyl-carrier-protein] synthase III